MNDVITILMIISISNCFSKWLKLILIVMRDWNVTNKLKNMTLIIKLGFNAQHCSRSSFLHLTKILKQENGDFFCIVNSKKLEKLVNSKKLMYQRKLGEKSIIFLKKPFHFTFRYSAILSICYASSLIVDIEKISLMGRIQEKTLSFSL